MKKETIIFKSSCLSVRVCISKNFIFQSNHPASLVNGISWNTDLPPTVWKTLLAFSVFYSLELLFSILGAQKDWRYCQGCCQLPKVQDLCLETWAAPEQSSCLWIQGTWTILKLSHFQVLMGMRKMKRSEFFKENKSRV